MIKALIFDFDNTLSDRSESIYFSLATIVDKYLPGLAWMDRESLIQHLLFLDEGGTINRQHIADYLLANYPLHEEALRADFRNIGVLMSPKTKLDPDTLALLEYLKAEGRYKLAILTNGDPLTQNAKIDRVGIRSYFDLVTIAPESGYAKPDPRAFAYVAAKLNVPVENCLYIGDVFFWDIIGAYHCGMQYLLINNERKRHYDPRIPYLNHLRELKDYLQKHADL